MNFMDQIDWPKYTRLVTAKLGALRLSAEKFPAGPAREKYAQDVFAPVFLTLAEFVESTGGTEQWEKFLPAEIDMLAAHAAAPLGTEFPAELNVTLHNEHGERMGEG